MHITSLAYDELCRGRVRSLPTDPRRIAFRDIRILSYQRYAALAGCSVEEVACGLEDAYVTRELRPGLNLILYNAAISAAREQHTLWHEIGHIRLGHRKHGDRQEVEANFFAQQGNAPNVLIRELEYRGYAIDAEFLTECFGLSKSSARKKMQYLYRFPDAHENPLDKTMLENFRRFLDEAYPARRKAAYS